MLEPLVAAIWMVFGAYTFWFFTLAKEYVPLTTEEAEFLWKLHKQFDQCNAKTWQKITHNGRLVGFKCECGYRYVQRRPITANSPAAIQIPQAN